MESNRIKQAEEKARHHACRAARTKAKIEAAQKAGDFEEVEYLQFMFGHHINQ